MPIPDPVPATILQKFDRAADHHYLLSPTIYIQSRMYFASTAHVRYLNFVSRPDLLNCPGSRTDINFVFHGAVLYGDTPDIGAQVTGIVMICPRATEAPWLEIRFGAGFDDSVLYVVPDPEFAALQVAAWSLHALGIDINSYPGGVRVENYVTTSIEPIRGSVAIPGHTAKLVRY